MQYINDDLKDFQILGVLGEGSFSKVKLVKRLLDGKLLALKQVKMEKLENKQIKSALNQIRLLASIHSPYIIAYQGSFYISSTNTLCILMQYADSGDLQNIINKTAKETKMEKGLPQNFIWRTIINILQGLKTLHDHKIVHRDIKTANIFYCQGIAKLGDFNVSAISDSAFYETKTGTPYYTAPQIWKGQKYTNNCDIWSLGCIVYQMCKLLPPFKAQSFPELFMKITNGQYASLQYEYSDDLKKFISLCLVVNKMERSTVNQLLGHQIIKKKLFQFKVENLFDGKVDLIKPLKCPKDLRFINSILPQTQQFHQQLPCISKNQNNLFVKSKSIKNQQYLRAPSISKKQIYTNQTKSAIRIKSSKKLKSICEPKSVKIIKSFGLQKNQIKITKNQILQDNSLVLEQKKINKCVKNQQFRLRSYKKIVQKENFNEI